METPEEADNADDDVNQESCVEAVKDANVETEPLLPALHVYCALSSHRDVTVSNFVLSLSSKHKIDHHEDKAKQSLHGVFENVDLVECRRISQGPTNFFSLPLSQHLRITIISIQYLKARYGME